MHLAGWKQLLLFHWEETIKLLKGGLWSMFPQDNAKNMILILIENNIPNVFIINALKELVCIKNLFKTKFDYTYVYNTCRSIV